VSSSLFDFENGQCILGQLREDLLGPGLEDLIHRSPQVVIAKPLGFDGGAKKQFRILFFEELGQPVQWCSSEQRVEHHAKDCHTGAQFHLGVDHSVDGIHQTDFLGIRFNNRHMLGIGDGHLLGIQRLHLSSLALGFKPRGRVSAIG